ncbi:SRF-type transcription factor (DNA-binding and dimerization domain)-domain-containing protein, partial [Mrakia frigida]|uniref:SRF-type transcription factor (DNA-binding and dimerization domain)-domain-containing protein n=1 Tax=Mrakia frigida TaxID=29902 RepID=UPI003FCBF1DD
RRKIQISYIEDKARRHITFSKRKAGIMKKAFELSTLTGTQVLLLVVSETGLVYTFTTSKLQPLVTREEGKNLIQVSLVWRCVRRRREREGLRGSFSVKNCC